MIVGVPRESYPGERRVALVPTVIPHLAKAGLEVVIEAGAGAGAGFFLSSDLADATNSSPKAAAAVHRRDAGARSLAIRILGVLFQIRLIQYPSPCRL